MSSLFDPEFQAENTNAKILFALERISEVFRVLLWNEATNSSLSPLQIQILIFLKFHPTKSGNVSTLAKEFNMSKATISEAVKTITAKGYAEKITDSNDRRNITLKLTTSGKNLAKKISTFAQTLNDSLPTLDSIQKEFFLKTLLDFIFKLYSAEVISEPRMCYSCKYYVSTSKKGFFCKLLRKDLPNLELRIDCPEHEKSLAV
jgi:DNA-binding MarR family transcriptional regulator